MTEEDEGLDVYCAKCGTPLDNFTKDETTEFCISLGMNFDHGDLCVSCTKKFRQFLG